MIKTWETQYLQLLQKTLDEGEDRVDRTGVGTRAIFGQRLDINLREGFPAVTTKKLAWNAMLSELKWFIEGSGDERRLAEILHGTRDSSKKTIWTDNANAEYWKPKAKFEGDLGQVYGVQWRNFNDEHVDQLQTIIEQLKTDPNSRRIILSAWNPAAIEEMALPPCHVMSQFRVINGELSCQMYQRSADFGLGVPFNIASYALLTHILAQITGLGVGEFIWTGGDCHIYKNHFEQVLEQIKRVPSKLPELQMPKFTSLDEVLRTAPSQYKLVGYNPAQQIKMQMAV